MITLVFMTDSQHVVGGSSWLRNLIRMPFLPMTELPAAMRKIMKGQHMVIGSGSKGFYRKDAENYTQAWLLSRHPAANSASSSLKICRDAQILVDRYKDSSDELLVLGGLSVWRTFLPHATQIRIAQTYRNVPGDLVFDEWTHGDFHLTNEERWSKLTLREYIRARW
jgi:dihydrofolate reductase